MYVGTSVVGGGLFPAVLVHVLPQLLAGDVVGRLVTVSAKPLNPEALSPLERSTSFDHELSHHVTTVDGVAAATVSSPSTKAPWLGKENTIAVFPVSADGS
jgi:hypothetical protein